MTRNEFKRALGQYAVLVLIAAYAGALGGAVIWFAYVLEDWFLQ